MAIANSRGRRAHGTVLEATDARQGFRGRHALVILVVSTALAVVALFIILAIQSPGLSGPGGQVSVTNDASGKTTTTPSPVKQTEPGGG